MSWQRWLVALLVLLFAVAYYGLAYLALRDIIRRPAVRGQNKTVWGLIVLCIPIIGALVYGYMGAAGFLPRAPAPRDHPESEFADLLRPSKPKPGGEPE